MTCLIGTDTHRENIPYMTIYTKRRPLWTEK
uniref:Uncharacterized protein n=1 Tax=Anguilla anguilla TaxID=7936 RepID=A0A0E9V8S5_ANGAN